MEDGEIRDQTANNQPILGDTYDPSYEWPGENAYDYTLPLEDDDNASLVPRPLRNDQPCFRLLVLRSSILPRKHKLVIADGYSELQFGRDLSASGSSTPRIRLKEMEVSKLHATAYWDSARKEWGVVDMGSKHGTFLESHPSDEKVRLSPPRVASIPKRLRHLDRLAIGSTLFLVHLHNSKVPCDQCSPHGGGDEIPLFPVQKEGKKTSTKRDRETSGIDAGSTTARDPKKALTKLKNDLLTRHEPGDRPLSPGSSQYVDRSARRRALGQSSHFDAPGIRSRAELPVRKPEVEGIAASAAHTTAAVPAPLPTSNIGHRLLMKQGWLPGSALGATRESDDDDWTRITEPIEVKLTAPRAGLGSTSAASIDIETSYNWRENGKLRRWAENNG